MLSTCFIMAALCAMRIVVLLPMTKVSRASCTTLLDSDSIAELASSNNNIGAFFKTTLAMAIRCFCPGVRSTPLIPT
uniref:Secreted protein n=1 Tax=Arundo donax TaxID=35708 RepID=A0A0A9E6U9_ARUDO